MVHNDSVVVVLRPDGWLHCLDVRSVDLKLITEIVLEQFCLWHSLHYFCDIVGGHNTFSLWILLLLVEERLNVLRNGVAFKKSWFPACLVIHNNHLRCGCCRVIDIRNEICLFCWFDNDWGGILLDIDWKLLMNECCCCWNGRDFGLSWLYLRGSVNLSIRCGVFDSL